MSRLTIQRGDFLSAASLMCGIWGVWMWWEAYSLHKLFRMYEMTSGLPAQVAVLGGCYLAAAVGLRRREPAAGILAVAVGLYVLRLYREPLPIIFNIGVVLMVVCGVRDFRWRARNRLKRLNQRGGGKP